MSRFRLQNCIGCHGKKTFRSEDGAREAIANLLRSRKKVRHHDFTLRPYRCPYDERLWHFGHKPVTAKWFEPKKTTA